MAELAQLRQYPALCIYAVCGVLGMTLVSTLATANSVYKYVEGGQVVYGDRAPTSSQDQGHTVLNKQGVVVEQVLSREEREKERRSKYIQEDAVNRDKALLASFTTEQDLILTRDDRLGMIDGQINRLDARIAILSKRLGVVDERVQSQEALKGEGNVKQSLYDQQRSIQRNIENAWSLVDAQAAERQKIDRLFADDLKRYRELKSGRS